MENKSIRIRTTPGVDKNIKIKLEQDFDFLEILSLKINQEDLYQTFCANYGVVVGRVFVNKGFGVSNAKVSVFIPISDEDQKNELIKDLYPFKTPFQKNPSTGVRYNLLLSKQTCILNKPVGTFPSKNEVLDNDIVLEVFEKYYKYTTKTNNSGDFMIFGVPVGTQQIHFDVDISDIGTASVRPYDMIANGYPEKLFESKVEFKSSSNLDLLPQIKSGNKTIDVIPFWGDTEQCEVGITRVDFDTNIEVTPTSLFFGSIFSDSGKMSLNRGCNPKNDMGEQDNLRTSSGKIKMIRVKEIDPEQWGVNGDIKPLSLEEFSINSDDLIDDDGVFAYTLPMNIGHAITDEFGMLVPSPDASIGIATKGMYRFAMNFNEPPSNRKRRTATMLFPSLGVDFGGSGGFVRGNNVTGTEDQRFSTDINAYNPSEFNKDFHTFEWKQLYTIAHFIKKFKKGGNRFSFTGIKNTDISGETNLFPFNNAIWKFDMIYYLMGAGIDVFAFLVKTLIQLIAFCFGFCLNLIINIPGVNVTLFKKTFTIGGWTIPIFSLCFSVCPWTWLGGLIGKIKLPADGGGPDGEGYVIDLTNCNKDGGYCGSSSQEIVGFKGCNSGCQGSNCSSTVTSFNGGVSPKPFPPNVDNNDCLKNVKAWQCRAKLNVAENRNVIRRNFNDAWVLGTAYLFQFKYKSRVQKKKTGLVKKEKYCGPGSDHVRGDNYKANKCCLDTKSDSKDCDKCLLRGPSETRNHSYYGIAQYHQVWHNSATTDKRTGAVDLDDIIYCNTLSATKIVSLGRVEMCQETLEQIELSIKAGKSLGEYTQGSNYYTGSFNENGWDAGYWVQQLGETSYEDPTDVFLYLAHVYTGNNCGLNVLFDKQTGCHEYELKDQPYFFAKEISKIYTDIVTVPDIVTGDDIFNPTTYLNPIADTVNVDADRPNATGGFEIDRELANRFSPCGAKGICVPYSIQYGNWNGNNGILGTGTQSYGGPWVDYPELSTYPQAFDYIIDLTSRNNQNTKSNIPYFYFGIHPGKTAINKLRKEYFFE